MLNLRTMPQKTAILLALLAFGVAWAVGLANGVPVHHISLRAAAAGAVFWLVGLIAGRVFLNSVCDALSEHLHASSEDRSPAHGEGGRR